MQMSYSTALAWGCSGAEHFAHYGEVRVIKQIITKLNLVGSQDPSEHGSASARRCLRELWGTSSSSTHTCPAKGSLPMLVW